jgi:hypothetical protein
MTRVYNNNSLNEVFNFYFNFGGGAVAQSCRFAPSVADPVHYPRIPIVGSDADWPGASAVMRSRLTGSREGVDALDFGSKNMWNVEPERREERAAVAWAMQNDDRVRYDVDSRTFFTTDTQGTRRDVAGLGEVESVIRANGGADPNNGAGFQATGRFIADRVAASDSLAQSAGPASTLDAMAQSSFLQMPQDSLSAGQGAPSRTVPCAGALRPPSLDQAGPPTGQALRLGDDGWPANTVVDQAGGHYVVNGGTSWAAYAPGVSHDGQPSFWVDGDPHLHTADGRTIDFTGQKGLDGKSGIDMVVPWSGTRIFNQTTDDQGHPVTNGLTFYNNNDTIQFNHVDGTPTTDGVRPTGNADRERHLALEGGRETWYLRGNQEHEHWMDSRHGQILGEITGSHDENGTYKTDVDSNVKDVGINQNFAPAWGTPNFRDWVQNQRADAVATRLGNDAEYALMTGRPGRAARDVLRADRDGTRRDINELFAAYGYGGWNTVFPDADHGFRALSELRQLLEDSSMLEAQQRRDLMAYNI